MKLSVVLATFNEQQNIGACLDSIKDLADEIVVFDEHSTDRTRIIAKNYGAKVYKYKHKTNFHETKQKAIDKAKGDWILQLDADERVTLELATEIKKVINFSNKRLLKRVLRHPGGSTTNDRISKKLKLFIRHQQLIEERDNISPGTQSDRFSAVNHSGSVRMDSPGVDRVKDVVAFFVPRLNFFLGKPIKHAGVYPDGVIRLFKKGKARLPAKSVHEVMEVDGRVAWLFSDLEHYESPTLKRYFNRMNRYTDLHAQQLKVSKTPRTPYYILLFAFYKPVVTFVNLYIKHHGFLDGYRGFLWSLLSSLHFPVAYYKYWRMEDK